MIETLASGLQAQMQRHEVLANNLANASTVGFKQDDVMLSPGGLPAGLGTAWSLVAAAGPSAAQWTDFSPAAIRRTERPLDVAIDGSGFFVLDTPRGPRYTRAGVLSVGRDGTLVSPTGLPVLGERGPIVVRTARPIVSADGEVQEDGQTLDKLRVVDFPKPYRLRKDADGLFVPPDPSVAPTVASDYQVVGGALEDSNVNTVRTMVQMIELLRSYESAQRAIQAADEADRFTANDMGRV